MKKQIGKRLRQIREAKGLSQAALGASLGIQYQHVSKYERGESVPTWENLIKLIETHHVNINWLLTGNGTIFLKSKGYTEIEDSSKPVIRDTEGDIGEIVAELRKDEELKKLIYDYIKSIGGAKRAAAALRRKANGLTADTTQRERRNMEE